MKFFGRNTLYDIATAVIITSLMTGFMTMSFFQNVAEKGKVLSAETEHVTEPTRYPTVTRKPTETPRPKRTTLTPKPTELNKKVTVTPKPSLAKSISITPMQSCKGEASTISKGRKLDTDAALKKFDAAKAKPGKVTVCRVSANAVVLRWSQPVGRDLPVRYKVYVQQGTGKLEYRTSAYATTVQIELVAGKEYKYQVTAVYKTGAEESSLVESALNLL